MVSRLNDAILLTREMVKQRWTPMAIMSMGPGWYEDQYLKTLGKLSDGPLSFAPWSIRTRSCRSSSMPRSPRRIRAST